jgi:hypothetical protein
MGDDDPESSEAKKIALLGVCGAPEIQYRVKTTVEDAPAAGSVAEPPTQDEGGAREGGEDSRDDEWRKDKEHDKDSEEHDSDDYMSGDPDDGSDGRVSV